MEQIHIKDSDRDLFLRISRKFEHSLPFLEEEELSSRQRKVKDIPSASLAIDKNRIGSLDELKTRLHVISACLESAPANTKPAELLLEGAISLLLDFLSEIEFEKEHSIPTQDLGTIVKEDDRHSDALGNVLMKQIPLRRPYLKFHVESTSPQILSIISVLQQLLTTHRVDQVRATAFRGSYDRKEREPDDESSTTYTDPMIEMMADDGKIRRQVRERRKKYREDYLSKPTTFDLLPPPDQWKKDKNGLVYYDIDGIDSIIRIYPWELDFLEISKENPCLYMSALGYWGEDTSQYPDSLGKT